MNTAGRTFGNNFSINNLPQGSYYATAYGSGANNVASGKSKTVAMVPKPAGTNTSNIQATKATLKWDTLGCVKYYSVQIRQQGAITWTTKKTSGNAGSFIANGLIANTGYEWRVAAADSANGITAVSAYTSILMFTTTASFAQTNTTHENDQRGNDKLLATIIYPNPASDQVHVQLNNIPGNEHVSMCIKNGSEQIVWNRSNIKAMGRVDADVSKLPAGVYYLEITSGENITRQ